MSEKPTVKRAKSDYESTDTPGLFKRKGVFWGRLAVGGKQRWKSFKTKNKADAQLILAGWRRELEAAKTQPVQQIDAKTFREFAEILQEKYRISLQVGDRERQYIKERIRGIELTWPELMDRDVRNITKDQIEKWMHECRSKKSASTTRGNVLVLKLIMAKAHELGFLKANPAENIALPSTSKKLSVAKAAQVSPAAFQELLASMRKGHGLSAQAADLAELLALLGVRLSEAVALRWEHVDWERGIITTTGAKWRRATDTAGTARALPFYGRLEEFLKRLWGSGKQLDQRVVRVKDARGTLRTHCAKLGLPRLHHHDMRHIFSTWAIEAGMDIPSVAQWLGHRDGGALLMRTYAHVRNEHLRTGAQKLATKFA